jgi:hypothetical protein
MTDKHILAGRLRQLAERLEADGTFGGTMVARDCREAAYHLDGEDRIEAFGASLRGES